MWSLRIRCLPSRKRRSLAKRPELTKARREAGRPNYDSQNARGLTASAAFPGPQRRLPEAARTGSASTRAALFPGTSGPGLERPATPSWVRGAGQRGVPQVARSCQPPDCPARRAAALLGEAPLPIPADGRWPGWLFLPGSAGQSPVSPGRAARSSARGPGGRRPFPAGASPAGRPERASLPRAAALESRVQAMLRPSPGTQRGNRARSDHP